MACILHIDTSTEVCSVAVSEDSHVIFEQQDDTGHNHAEKIGTFVDEALSFTDNHAIPFDAVAVSGGPGSYTGLRIGVSMAKGICYARNLDVVDADTYKKWLDERPVYFFGGGAKKCMEAIGHPNARYIDGIKPLAKWMQPLAERRLMNDQTESVAYYEPFYLKDFVAKMPKKLL